MTKKDDESGFETGGELYNQGRLPNEPHQEGPAYRPPPRRRGLLLLGALVIVAAAVVIYFGAR